MQWAKRGWVIFLFFTLLIVTLLSYFLFWPLVSDPQGFRYTLKPGTSVTNFVTDLTNQQIITHPVLFKFYFQLCSDPRKLKTGEYFFPKGTNTWMLVDRITTGKGMIYHTFMIVGGWDFQTVRKTLEAENKLKQTLLGQSDAEIMTQLGRGDLNPEGEFFPETYYFTEGSTDIALLKRAFQLMQTRLEAAWQTRDGSLPFETPYQALIAASLVEKEAYLNDERPVIAGVLINRLRKDMRLQFDPTVIYGLRSSYDGTIHKNDLLKKTAYNTYLFKGLPPTPIAMPSMQSILAVLHPKQHDYLYFVAKGDGSHQFSKTLPEHHEAVAQAKKEPFFNEPLLRLYLLKNLNLRNQHVS